MRIDKEELQDCISTYMYDVVSWSMSEWIADQLAVSVKDVEVALNKDATFKKIKRLVEE